MKKCQWANWSCCWNPLSERTSGWLVSLFSFCYWIREGQLKKSPRRWILQQQWWSPNNRFPFLDSREREAGDNRSWWSWEELQLYKNILILWISYCWCLLGAAATQRKYFELNLNWGDVHLPAFAPCAALIPGLHEYTWIFKRMWYRLRGMRVFENYSLEIRG